MIGYKIKLANNNNDQGGVVSIIHHLPVVEMKTEAISLSDSWSNTVDGEGRGGEEGRGDC